MMSGAIDKLFTDTTDSTITDIDATTDRAKDASGHFMDKISDLIPGEAGEKAEYLYEEAKDILTGLFSGKKI